MLGIAQSFDVGKIRNSKPLPADTKKFDRDRWNADQDPERLTTDAETFNKVDRA